MKKEDLQSESPTKSKAKTDYFEIRIPRISFKDSSANTYLIFVVVIFAFILGMLTNKVIFLEKEVKTTNANVVNTQPNQAANTIPSPTPIVRQNVDVGKFPLQGNTNAKVTVVEFADFQCPFCKQFFDDTYKQLIDTYVKTGKVKFAYRNFPLYSIHPNAAKAAEAAECANDQGKFWDYHDLLYNNQTTWSQQAAADAASSFSDYAGQLGLDVTQFQSCLSSSKDKPNVDTDAAAGNAVGVDGTPTFFINGWPVVGAVPFSDLKKQIEQELKK